MRISRSNLSKRSRRNSCNDSSGDQHFMLGHPNAGWAYAALLLWQCWDDECYSVGAQARHGTKGLQLLLGMRYAHQIVGVAVLGMRYAQHTVGVLLDSKHIQIHCQAAAAGSFGRPFCKSFCEGIERLQAEHHLEFEIAWGQNDNGIIRHH